MATTRKNIQRSSRVHKARIITTKAVGPDELPEPQLQSKQLLEDPFLGLSGYGGAIPIPPYSPEQLVLLAEQHPAHAAALEQKAVDVVSKGAVIAPTVDDANEAEGLEIEEWLESLTMQHTFVELIQAVWLDYETVGWGCIEVVRDSTGIARRLVHVPAHTVRFHRDGRRLIQKRSGKRVWYKKWGAEGMEGFNIMLSTGRVAPDGTPFEKIANDMLVFVKTSRRSSWYGIPAYVSGIGHITMSLAARDYNIKFFSNAREPRWLLIVSGLDDEGVESTLDQLEESLKTQHIDPHRNMILPLTGSTTAKIERMTVVQNDLQFTKLMELCDKNIFISHRMPPDRLGYAVRGLLGGNASASLNRIYKDAVVAPAQTILKDRLNNFLVVEYPKSKSKDKAPVKVVDLGFEITFESLDLSDETVDIMNTLAQVAKNIITMNEGREQLGYPPMEGMDVTLSEFLVDKGLKIQESASGEGFAQTLAAIHEQMDTLNNTVHDIMVDGEEAKGYNDQIEEDDGHEGPD